MIGALNPDGSVNVMIESPRGSTAKFKYDPVHQVVVLSRPLPSGLAYPFDWGFVPGTLGPDGDPVDAMVYWDRQAYPGVVIPSRLVGALEIEQTHLATGRRERNDRLIAVPVKAAALGEVTSVAGIPERTRRELEQFFIAAAAFEGKDPRVLGWAGPEEADALVRRSIPAGQPPAP